MNNRLIILFFGALLIASPLLNGCSSDDSTDAVALSESVTISVDGGTAVSYTTGTEISGAYFTTVTIPGSVLLPATAIKGGSLSGTGVYISFTGNTTGILNVADNDVYLSYTESDTNVYHGTSAFNTTGTVTVTEYGAVGELITGSFDIPDSVINIGAGGTAALTGTFSVVREADDTGF